MGFRFLCLDPNHPTLYQARSHSLKQWSMRSTKPGPISVGLMDLDRPVQELFQEVRQHYNAELDRFNILLLP